MKEAAGEANLTVVAIILIGVVVAVVTPIVNSMMKNTAKRACCTDAGYIWKGNSCYDETGTTEIGKDKYLNSTGDACKGE